MKTETLEIKTQACFSVQRPEDSLPLIFHDAVWFILSLSLCSETEVSDMKMREMCPWKLYRVYSLENL